MLCLGRPLGGGEGHLSVCLLDTLPLPVMPKVCYLDSALFQSVPSSFSAL